MKVGNDAQHRGGGDGRSAAVVARISWKCASGTMTSAPWKAIDRPWRTILAPTFISRSGKVVIDQWMTASGSAKVRRKVARLTSAWSWSRTALVAKRRQDRRVQMTAFEKCDSGSTAAR
jgi:hypothetical protein